MNRIMARRLSLSLLIVALLANTALAITWFPKDFVCPICKTKNTFLVVGSYGNYIYNDPSKYQYIYWPLTDSPTVYTCQKCHLSVFMWDFEKVPSDKLPAISKQLEGVDLKLKYKKYTDIPMSKRLEIAEKVYRIVGGDDDFWCRFYRTMGYHYDREKNQHKADESRTKALDLANKMLNDPATTEPRKELLLIMGAMKHFLRDDKGAITELKQAIATKFYDKRLNDEQNESGEQNLLALLEDYIKKIQSPEKPRLMQDRESH